MKIVEKENEGAMMSMLLTMDALVERGEKERERGEERNRREKGSPNPNK